MDVPGYGEVGGEWDLRGKENEYLGGVDFQGKRVLDVGTSSGFLTFYMESQGAEVVSFDLSREYISSLDIAPSKYNLEKFLVEYRAYIEKLNNAYWLSHAAYHSKAKMVYGTVYDIPKEIGRVDISVFGSILLHIRDPFLALHNALRLTREKVIVVEPLWKARRRFITKLLARFAGPYMAFITPYRAKTPQMGWWLLTPEIIKAFIAALGFEQSEVTYHSQTLRGCDYGYYTVVGHRTAPFR
jgi:SAM-dependent methyltransferase